MQSTDVVRLIISGPNIAADQVRSLVHAEPLSIDNANPTSYRVELISPSNPSTAEGRLMDWCGLLLKKSAILRQLLRQGHHIYLQCELTSTELEIDAAVLKQLTELDIGITVQFKPEKLRSNSISSSGQLIISEPLKFYSQVDEDCFYKGLMSIEAVTGLEMLPGNPLAGEPNKIVLELNQPLLDEYSLRDLIGLMFRYSVDLSSLRTQCTTKNSTWLKSPTKYWHDKMWVQ